MKKLIKYLQESDEGMIVWSQNGMEAFYRFANKLL